MSTLLGEKQYRQSRYSEYNNTQMQISIDLDNYMTAPAAAESLGIHRSTVYAAIASKRLPAQNIGRTPWIHKDDVEAYRLRTQTNSEKRVGRPPRKRGEVE